MEFRTELTKGAGNTAGFVVPDEVVDALGAGRRPRVVVTLLGHEWRSSIAVMGGVFMLGVSQANREASGAAPGEVYDVTVTVDSAPRSIEVAADLSAALDAAGARPAWDRLSYSHQRQHAEAIAAAEAPETRARRIAKAVEGLTAP